MLNDKAMIIHLNISQWAGRKLDKKATAEVQSANAAKSESGNYTKKLLPKAKELDRVSSAAAKIREFFYLNSLPWLADGGRIIANANYLKFTSDYRNLKLDFEKSVSEFLNAYPQLVLDAQKSLGALYNPSDYPSVSELKHKFKCDITPMPMPSVSDFRVDLNDFEKKQFVDKMADLENKAMADCWQRLHEVVSKAAQKLSDPSANFRDSLIGNISEICEILPRLNVANDSNLESERQKVSDLVKSLKPDLLRSNANERNAAAEKLAEITKAMGAFMGG